MRLLHRLGYDIAQRKIEIGPVIFAATVAEHRDDRAHRVFPHRAFLVERDPERLKLGAAGTLAHAEFGPPAADQIEGGDALGDPRRRARGQLHDAMGEPDLFGALAGGAKKHLGGRRMRIFLEEVMLDLPGEVVTEAVGEFDLVERVLVEAQFAVRLPGPRQLQLIEDAKLHCCLPPAERLSRLDARR